MGIPISLREQIRKLYGRKIEEKHDFTVEHAASFLKRFFLPDDQFDIGLSNDQLGLVVTCASHGQLLQSPRGISFSASARPNGPRSQRTRVRLRLWPWRAPRLEEQVRPA